jgi:PEP-CTERM motif
MMYSARRTAFLLAAIASCCLPSSAWAGGGLLNGGFNTPTPGLTPPTYLASISGAGVSGQSSAEYWTLYNNFNGTTSTELLSTTDPKGSGYMIELTSTTNTSSPDGSFFNGLQQLFPTQSGGTASVDVYVSSGPVILALYAGDGAALINYTLSTTTNAWQTLAVTAPAGSDPNLFVLYSYSTTGTGQFYADNASISIPEPASGMLAAIGMAGSALWFRKVQRRSKRRHAQAPV